MILVISILFSGACWSKQSFESWKKSYAKRAARRGLPTQYVLEVLEDVEEDMEVVEKDRNQITASTTKDYKEFIVKWLREDPSRIEEGKKLLKENFELLDKVEKKYRVEKEVIVALWGTETLYGQITGDFDLIRSLATLAYEGRRRRFFEIQLNAALRMLRNGHVKRENLKGSWAGATGQCQFMPSNFPAYAQDFDRDGKKDIWTTKADVFASIANLLKKVGWQYGKMIGSLALNTKNYTENFEKYRTQAEYNRLGFRNTDGSKIKDSGWRARKAAEIPMKNSPVVLRGSNYKPLLKWNNSSLFAAFNILLVEGFKH